MMFRLVGGLERPFDRSQNMGPNCLNLWNPNLVFMVVTGCWVVNWYNLCHKSCCGLYETGNGREIRVHKVNRRLVIFRE